MTDVDRGRIEALERVAHAQNEALRVLVDHVRAVALVSSAAIAMLDADGRAVVRGAALIGLGDGPGTEQAAALIEAFTRDPVAALVDVQASASAVLADGGARLQ